MGTKLLGYSCSLVLQSRLFGDSLGVPLGIIPHLTMLTPKIMPGKLCKELLKPIKAYVFEIKKISSIKGFDEFKKTDDDFSVLAK